MGLWRGERFLMTDQDKNKKSKRANATTRFGTGKNLATFLLPTLPNSTYAAVILYCWLMGEQKSEGVTEFNESNNQIAEACKISPRHVSRVIGDLERQGIVETIWKGRGKWPAKRLIRSKTYKAANRGETLVRSSSDICSV